jgi:hypothetical protein
VSTIEFREELVLCANRRKFFIVLQGVDPFEDIYSSPILRIQERDQISATQHGERV